MARAEVAGCSAPPLATFYVGTYACLCFSRAMDETVPTFYVTFCGAATALVFQIMVFGPFEIGDFGTGHFIVWVIILWQPCACGTRRSRRPQRSAARHFSNERLLLFQFTYICMKRPVLARSLTWNCQMLLGTFEMPQCTFSETSIRNESDPANLSWIFCSFFRISDREA